MTTRLHFSIAWTRCGERSKLVQSKVLFFHHSPFTRALFLTTPDLKGRRLSHMSMGREASDSKEMLDFHC